VKLTKAGEIMNNLNKEIIEFYEHYSEDQRLQGISLEKIRTQELVSRHLNNKKMRILDVGGGTGIYSFWLSEQGHEVHMVDASVKHIEQAHQHSLTSGLTLKSLRVGDARKLEFDDECFDAVLLFGPLYHLTEREDRIIALSEAKRVLKAGGLIFTAVISRYASLVDGFQYNLIEDPDFINIMFQDLSNGQHRNIEGKNYFTTSIFHLPEELELELIDAGFHCIELFAIESFAETITNIRDQLENEEYKNLVLKTIRKIEQDKAIMGISPHIMGVGKKY
jgi:ubiquinone/menaquinone biosynthesis C-methylase UbiE